MSSQRTDFLYFLSFLQRRKWQILIPTLVLLGLTAAVIKSLPPTYRSSATILIEESEVPSEIVRSTITGYADQHIQVIGRQVMTRANLKQIIEKFDLYRERRNAGISDALIQRVRGNIGLEMLSVDITDKRSGTKTAATIAFVLSYAGESAEQARNVTNELVSLFLSENHRSRQQQAADAERLLSEEVQRLERQIADIERNLARFKERNAEQLPEQAQVNLQLRERSEVEILDAERQISALLQRKVDLESQLAQTRPHLPAISASGERVLDSEERLRMARAQYESMLGVYSPDHPDVQRLRQEIEGLQQQLGDTAGAEQLKEADRLRTTLAALRERYSEEHPDVVAAKIQLQALEASLRSKKSMGPFATQRDKTADNPAYLTLRAQLASTQVELGAVRSRQAQSRAKLEQYAQRLRETPQAEREYQDITRERDNALRRYQEVRAKLMDVQAAQTLERTNKAERLSVLEPANLPERPVRPNRIALALLGAVLSFGAGLAYAGIREAMDRTIHSPEQLAATSRSPVLASIPYIPARGEPGKQRLRTALGS